MFRVRPRLLLASAILLLLPVRLPAQPATATLFVQIEDATGGRLPGATLVVRNQATAVERRAVTTAEGAAAIPLLSAGDYRLTATLTGFRTAVVDRFHLEAGAVRTLRLVLQAGDVHETVQVSGNSAEIRAGSGAVGEIFSGQILTMTPVASRDVGEYAWQAAGCRAAGARVTPLRRRRDAAERRWRARGLEQLPARRRRQQRPVSQPRARHAEPRRRPGVHADLEHLRRAVRTQRRRAGQRGAEVGQRPHDGIVVRVRPRPCAAGTRAAGSAGSGRAVPSSRPGRRHDRRPDRAARRVSTSLSLDGTRDRSGDTRVANVPSDAERAGDFSGLATPIIDPATGQPFPGNRIPASRFDATGLASARPLPARESHRARSGNFVSSPVAPDDTWQFTGRFDRPSNAKVPLFVRYSYARDDHDLAFPGPGKNVPGFGTRTVDGTYNLVVGSARAFGQHTFNDLRVGWNRLARDVFPDNVGVDGYAALGMTGPSLGHDDLGYPALSVTGLDPVGDDVSLPVVRRHEHAARHRHRERRSRASFPQGRRRASTLLV